MNDKIGSKVTLLKDENKESVMWDVTPIPHWLSKKFHVQKIYLIKLIN